MAAIHRAWLCLVVVLTLQTLPQAHGFFPIFKRKPKPKPLPPPEAGNMEARPAFPPVARTTYDPYLYGQQRLRTEAESATDEAFERLAASINVNQNPKDYVDLIKYGKIPALTKRVLGDADYNIKEENRVKASGKPATPRLVPVVVPLPGQQHPQEHSPLPEPPIPDSR